MSIDFLLDTDTFIDIKNHRPPHVLERFSQLKPGTIGISVITYGELIRGAERSQYTEKNHAMLNRFIELIPVQAMPSEAGIHYGEIRTVLEKSGQVIGNNDLWIAAHARAIDVVLVTNNSREFCRVDALRVENWT